MRLSSIAAATAVILAATAAGSMELLAPKLSVPGMSAEKPDIGCVTEAAAYSEVGDLALIYGDEADVFAGALHDLREQLIGCLEAVAGGQSESSTPWQGGESTRI